MDANVRIWVSTVAAGLIAAGIGAYDAFVNHAATFGAAGDTSFIFAGLGALGLKGAFDLGVQVPTPPKP
jgi:hypothetical protein